MNREFIHKKLAHKTEVQQFFRAASSENKWPVDTALPWFCCELNAE